MDRALALVRQVKATELERATQIELRIVESGIRRDQGLPEAAVIALHVPELTRGRLRPWSARLFYAYADALLAAGRAEEARDWFARAAEADTDGGPTRPTAWTSWTASTSRTWPTGRISITSRS